MTCDHGDHAFVDCGLELICGICTDVYSEAGVRRLAGLGWLCPVCRAVSGHDATQMVVHHDHFGDAVWMGLSRKGQNRDDLETFRRTVVCGACNRIDAEAKAALPKLPKWFSLSPDDMRDVLDDNGAVVVRRVVEVWNRRRTTTFAEKLRALAAAGEDPIRMREALAAYLPPGRTAKRTRIGMIHQVDSLATNDRVFRRQLDQRGNDVWLLRYLKQHGLERGELHSFLYFYHRKHGDPKLIDRPEGLGVGQFFDWLLLMVDDQQAEAAAYKAKCERWRRRKA